MPDKPINLPMFMDYANELGSGRMAIVQQQRKRIEDPEQQAFHYYAPAVRGLPLAIASTDPAAILDTMLDQTTTTHQRQHHVELRDGMLETATDERTMNNGRRLTRLAVDTVAHLPLTSGYAHMVRPLAHGTDRYLTQCNQFTADWATRWHPNRAPQASASTTTCAPRDAY